MTKSEDTIGLKNENGFIGQLKIKQRRHRSETERLAAPGAASRPLRNDPAPQLELVQVPIQELRLPGRKLRKLNPAHVAEVAGSISTFGFSVPITIDQNNVVVDGATRLEAARQIGFETVPCIRIGHLTDAELRALRLAINRHAEKNLTNRGQIVLDPFLGSGTTLITQPSNRA